MRTVSTLKPHIKDMEELGFITVISLAQKPRGAFPETVLEAHEPTQHETHVLQ